MPAGVTWIRGAAKSFEPDKNTVRLQNGDALTYDYLVVCTGVKLDWDKIAGLADTLGRNGVCSNYSPEHRRATPGNACRRSRPATRSCARSRRCRSNVRARRRRSST